MTRKRKTGWMSLMLPLVLCAMAPTAAMAAEFDVVGESQAKIIGEQEAGNSLVLTVDGSSVECDGATFATEGEQLMPAGSTTVLPTYEDCTAFGFDAAVNTAGCGYEISAGGDFGIVGVGEGCVIQIAAVSCEVLIGTQQLGEQLTLSNLATSPISIRIVTNVGGIAVHKAQDGFLCPLEGTGEGVATLAGNLIAGGDHEGEIVGLTVD